jgi:hypothetical protein
VPFSAYDGEFPEFLLVVAHSREVTGVNPVAARADHFLFTRCRGEWLGSLGDGPEKREFVHVQLKVFVF